MQSATQSALRYKQLAEEHTRQAEEHTRQAEEHTQQALLIEQHEQLEAESRPVTHMESTLSRMHQKPKLVITPISSKIKKKQGVPCARTDYNEQLERNKPILNGNMFFVWDDGPLNLAKVGDYFVFWDHSGEVREGTNSVWVGGHFIFHRIMEVHLPEHRLPSWSPNVGQTDRNVLALSPPITRLTFAEIQHYGLTPNYRQTSYAKTGWNEREVDLRQLIEFCDQN